MPRTWLLLAVLMFPLLGADDPMSARARRIIAGRCVTRDGQSPQAGRIFFRPDDRAQVFLAAWSTPLDAEGRYRIELVDAVQRSLVTGERVTSRAAGPLRFEVLAPGYRAEVGVVATPPGTDPLTCEVRLTAEAWRETEWQLVDEAGRPVADGEVTQEMAASKEWMHLRTDTNGLCRVSSPPGRGYGITAWRPGSVLTSVVAMGTADEPPRVIVPIREPIRGRIVDPAGRPVAGLRMGRLITMDDEADDPSARRRFILLPFSRTAAHPVTDPDGRFMLDLPVKTDTRGITKGGELRLFPQALCFADAACRRVAFVALDRRKPRAAYDVPLAPTRQVRFPVEHTVTSASGKQQTWWTLNAKTDAIGASTPIFVASGSAFPEAGGGSKPAGDWIEAFLPPGSYEMQINSADPAVEKGLEETTTRLDVPPGEGELILPALALTPLVHDQMAGKPAPEIDAKDLDTGAPVRLADFRGRVVVLDFWGYWCGPCLGALPELIKLHDEFVDQPVTILALHDQSIQSRAAFDVKLGTVRRSSWNDRDLPFRVALDRPAPDLKPDDSGIGGGVSARRYSVALWPTTLLIDQTGQVIGTVNPRDHGAVAAQIKTLLAAPPSR